MGEKLKIELLEYDHTCGDGCCRNWGIKTTVNGQELQFHNTDIKTIVEQILEHLGYEVEVEHIFEGDE